MRAQQQRAFVLHARNYSETSLLLEVFSAQHGRIGLIAKGARRPQSRQRALLKPFQPLLVGWSGRGELMVLTGAEPDGPDCGLHGAAVYCGFYVNELLMRLLHRDDPHERLYESYRAALAALADDSRREATLRIFEKHLLRDIGYGLVLDRDVNDGAAIADDALYDYIPERGPVRIAHPELHTKIHGVRLHGISLRALEREALVDARVLRETKLLMRTLLAPHLGDRPLQSRQLFRDVGRRAGVEQEGAA